MMTSSATAFPAPSSPAQGSAVSVGLIGTGRMGRSHLRAAQAMGCSLVALCDTNADHLRTVGEEFGVDASRRFGDIDEFFSTRRVADLIIVATTADSHAPLVLRAAESGARFILCEKPLATSLADCQAMIDACRRRGVRLAVNHQMRFMDQYTLVKRHLAGESFGPLASMNVVGGCFGLAMNGSHYFEAFRYLASSPIVEVSARLDPAPLASPRGPRFFDRSGQVHAVAASGARLHLEIGADQGHGMTVTYATRHGHLFVDELAGVCQLTCRQEEHRAQPATRYGLPWRRWEESFPPADNVAPTRCVLEALLSGDDYPTGEDGRHAVAALVAAYCSSERAGAAVGLGDLKDSDAVVFPWA